MLEIDYFRSTNETSGRKDLIEEMENDLTDPSNISGKNKRRGQSETG